MKCLVGRASSKTTKNHQFALESRCWCDMMWFFFKRLEAHNSHCFKYIRSFSKMLWERPLSGTGWEAIWNCHKTGRWSAVILGWMIFIWQPSTFYDLWLEEIGCGYFTVLFPGCKGPAFFISPLEATQWLGWNWLYIEAVRWYDLFGSRKTIALGTFWASEGRKVFQRWQQPKISDQFGHVWSSLICNFFVSTWTKQMCLSGSWSAKGRCSRDHQNQRPGWR